nr:hypothetical protein [Arthrobacter sp. CAL618]
MGAAGDDVGPAGRRWIGAGREGHPKHRVEIGSDPGAEERLHPRRTDDAS